MARVSWPTAEVASNESLNQHALALEPDASLFTEALEITDGELLEFLACDLDPTEADPEFREQLKEELWEMVEGGRLGQRRDH
ncbi:MAG: hypothetical protein JRG86_01495 [Deltaproteobacteria bacterium]|nr:hypothetical protein [Deltaproteobacteria bacterium]MBW2495718.1 hypothetical protein [Deltaproteobacteria bacterium]